MAELTLRTGGTHYDVIKPLKSGEVNVELKVLLLQFCLCCATNAADKLVILDPSGHKRRTKGAVRWHTHLTKGAYGLSPPDRYASHQL